MKKTPKTARSGHILINKSTYPISWCMVTPRGPRSVHTHKLLLKKCAIARNRSMQKCPLTWRQLHDPTM